MKRALATAAFASAAALALGGSLASALSARLFAWAEGASRPTRPVRSDLDEYLAATTAPGGRA